jgi:hypothetical protein
MCLTGVIPSCGFSRRDGPMTFARAAEWLHTVIWQEQFLPSMACVPHCGSGIGEELHTIPKESKLDNHKN